MMKILHLITSLCIVLISNNFMNMWWGSCGLEAQARLESNQEELQKELSFLQDSLSREQDRIEALRNDPRMLRLEAYRIGLLEKGDVTIRDNPLMESKTEMYALPLKKAGADTADKPSFWGISLIIGTLFLLLITFIDFGNPSVPRKPSRQKTVAQELGSLIFKP